MINVNFLGLCVTEEKHVYSNVFGILLILVFFLYNVLEDGCAFIIS